MNQFVNPKKGAVVIQILIVLVVIVLTSGIILLLISQEVIKVSESGDKEILDAEFVPVGGASGVLTIKDFSFCSWVDETQDCTKPRNVFYSGEYVFFRFVVQSTTYNGQIILIEDYEIISSEGKVLLSVNDKEDYIFDKSSVEKTEDIIFIDFFNINEISPAGVYTLKLIVKNPLIDKTTILNQEFEIYDYQEALYLNGIPE